MLEHLFGSKTRVKLLQIFFRAPIRAYYVRELARLTNTQLNAIRREIANLLSLGLVTQLDTEQAGAMELGTERSKYYQLNTGSLLFNELKALFVKSAMLEEEVFVREVQNKGGQISLLALTGFFCGEEEVDTDLLIVGKVRPTLLNKLIKDYESEIARTIRYTIMEEKEFKDRRELGDKFLYRIFEAKHIMVVDKYHVS